MVSDAHKDFSPWNRCACSGMPFKTPVPWGLRGGPQGVHSEQSRWKLASHMSGWVVLRGVASLFSGIIFQLRASLCAEQDTEAGGGGPPQSSSFQEPLGPWGHRHRPGYGRIIAYKWGLRGARAGLCHQKETDEVWAVLVGDPPGVPSMGLMQQLPISSVTMSLHTFLVGWREAGVPLCLLPLRVPCRACHPRPRASEVAVRVTVSDSWAIPWLTSAA